jgi:hypothetical protein
MKRLITNTINWVHTRKTIDVLICLPMAYAAMCLMEGDYIISSLVTLVFTLYCLVSARSK